MSIEFYEMLYTTELHLDGQSNVRIIFEAFLAYPQRTTSGETNVQFYH